MYKFSLPIGDWSDDGHGECDWFVIESNVPLEELREIYFETKKRTNASLDSEEKRSPCSNHEGSQISKQQIKKLGLNPKNYKVIINKTVTLIQKNSVSYL